MTKQAYYTCPKCGHRSRDGQQLHELGIGQLINTIEFLWVIIDDIDTYSDMAKGDDKLYRSLVQRRQKHRWETGITTDGYKLDIDLTKLRKLNLIYSSEGLLNYNVLHSGRKAT